MLNACGTAQADDTSNRLVQDAIRHKHAAIQSMLLEGGSVLGECEVERRLCEAAANNHLELLQTYIRNGASVNSTDHLLRTPLHGAPVLPSCAGTARANGQPAA